MFRFRKKRGEEGEPGEKSVSGRGGKGKSMLERVKTGLNSQWFRSQKYSVLKELEGTEQKRGVLDDSSKERAIASILGSLEGAAEAFSNENDQEGLRDAAELFLTAYTKTGNAGLLDRHADVCAKAGITEEEIIGKLVEAADAANQIDIIVTLYARAGATEKLVGAGNRGLSLYLEASDIDMNSRSRLFDYVVEAYKTANDKDTLIQAGDKALKSQMEGRRLSREKDWVLDAQKAYHAAGDKDKLAKLADQYVNLYFKEGLETWLDKAIAAYEEAEVDSTARLSSLADKVEEKGRSGMADTMRRKVGL
ncbi:hypothetical protein ACFL6S_26605 [Candidatus Poribacteria bacterium]